MEACASFCRRPFFQQEDTSFVRPRVSSYCVLTAGRQHLHRGMIRQANAHGSCMSLRPSSLRYWPGERLLIFFLACWARTSWQARLGAVQDQRIGKRLSEMIGLRPGRSSGVASTRPTRVQGAGRRATTRPYAPATFHVASANAGATVPTRWLVFRAATYCWLAHPSNGRSLVWCLFLSDQRGDALRSLWPKTLSGITYTDAAAAPFWSTIRAIWEWLRTVALGRVRRCS